MTTLLLVEDNEDNRDMLARRLMRRGYKVEVAIDGQQGVDLAHALLPDLILMDMNLPILDGWGATQQIKASEVTHHIPVIGLTAHHLPGDRDRCLAAGCDDYDTKPIEFSRLLSKMNALLHRELRSDWRTDAVRTDAVRTDAVQSEVVRCDTSGVMAGL